MDGFVGNRRIFMWLLTLQDTRAMKAVVGEEATKTRLIRSFEHGSEQTITLPETNGSHMKMDCWNTSLLLGRPFFRCYLSFGECNGFFRMEL